LRSATPSHHSASFSFHSIVKTKPGAAKETMHFDILHLQQCLALNKPADRREAPEEGREYT
jgi:hypothetical protein